MAGPAPPGGRAPEVHHRRSRWPGCGGAGARAAALVALSAHLSARAGACPARRAAVSCRDSAGRPSVSSSLMSASDHPTAHPGKMLPALVLASASPRRRELLWQLGVPHWVAVAVVSEAALGGESAADCVQRLALAKAMQVLRAGATAGQLLRCRGSAAVRDRGTPGCCGRAALAAQESGARGGPRCVKSWST